MAEVKLHPDWLAAIGGEFEQPYMAALKQFLAGERAKGKAIYPRPRDWFAALDATPPRDVRVVILGQARAEERRVGEWCVRAGWSSGGSVSFKKKNTQ